MINRIFTGSRCKNVRPIAHPGGAIDRHTTGTIRYGLENLGRDLVIGLDDGSLQLAKDATTDVNRPIELRRTVKEHTAAVVSLAFSADGARLASGSLDRSVIVWDVPKLFGGDHSA